MIYSPGQKIYINDKYGEVEWIEIIQGSLWFPSEGYTDEQKIRDAIDEAEWEYEVIEKSTVNGEDYYCFYTYAEDWIESHERS